MDWYGITDVSVVPFLLYPEWNRTEKHLAKYKILYLLEQEPPYLYTFQFARDIMAGNIQGRGPLGRNAFL